MDSSSTPVPPTDLDAAAGALEEQAEWIESVDAMIAARGVQPAGTILDEVVGRARARGVGVTGRTAYRNTIPDDLVPPYPGDEQVEGRINAYLRWNAMAMVVRANKHHDGIGGHLSTYASTQTLWEVGFEHFFHGRGDQDQRVVPGDQVFFQGHASPGIYARAFLEGRLSEQELDLFRQEVTGPVRGLPSYPHPRAMGDFWEFPTVSLGIGPLNAVHQARMNRYLAARGLVDTDAAHVWCFVGDGETDEPETLAAIRLAARERLDNLTFVVSCNLQRLDGPVRGNTRIVDELEGVFRGAGWRVVKVLWGSEWEALFTDPAGPRLQARLEAMNDGDLQRLTVLEPAELRAELFGDDPALARLGASLDDGELRALRRGGHDPRQVHAAYADALAHRDGPTVVLAQTVKGYALGPNFEGRNATHQMKKMTAAQLKIFRDILDLPITDSELSDGLPPYLRLPEGSEELRYLRERRATLGGVLPRRPVTAAVLPSQPGAPVFEEFDAGSSGRPTSTTVAYTRLLRGLMRDPEIGPRVVPVVPDEGRSFGFEVLYSEFGIYAPGGQRYTPVDAGLPLSYREAAAGQVLQVGITEAGGLGDFTAAATAGATWDTAVIPFFTYYSMFGFQRVGDLIWALADARGRGFLAGATAGRTTLSGEGVQHTDGSSHLAALAVPSCRAYDPGYAYETATIVRDGIRRMYGQGEECFYYLTLYNENYAQAAKPSVSGVPGVDVDDAIVAGLYRLDAAPEDRPAQVRLLASGPSVLAARQARDRLAQEHGISAEVWSVTSWKALRDDALETERWNREHLSGPRRTSYLRRALSTSVPTVAVTDYVTALPDQLARFVRAPFTALGTDGYGWSDTREALRAHFGTDADGIASATLALLAENDADGRPQPAPTIPLVA
ncbi:pyruvate dehydrogenase (acetyl-transferring), homodimeric type [Isoptericola sp. b490]|uniref:pyruvate dehydrogenase (acetyl-transferring), homodimeric type n=1 Tax=Actinotalea lenta TaxID=3064654 RepID=UPI0027132DCD|nr:pyruvate dehydrogenase (acetyl-transferring), homodimeric type [Isoptericola sp. b490]MDO8121154.1 pyruvate dehydrogenase (acetyl-transferring), homodimeric type [Isoptericola sp. b490]